MIHIHRFTNGLQLVHQRIKHTQVGHWALVGNVGTRDEKNEHENGLAHFTEHLLFKGTQKRSAHKVNTYLDEVGGEVNAYTTKEKLCLYASFIDPHTRKALDLLLDQYFFSTFPSKELEKEKSVVIDEIHLYQDSPDEQIFDVFEEKLFAGTPLGTNILGTEHSVTRFHTEMVASFHRNYFTAENSVLAYSGNWPLSKVVAAVERYLEYMPTGAAPKRKAFQKDTPFQIQEPKNCQQVYKNLGALAFSAAESQRIPMLLLTAILGGDNANSRLNLNIREKVGLVYQIEAQYNPMTDAGLFNIFFSSDPKYASKIEGLIDKELMKLCTKALSTGELHRFKTQFKSKVLMGEESRQGLIAALAKNLLDFGRIDSLDEVFKAIDAITSADLLACANDQIHPNRLSRLTYFPEA